MYQHHGGNRLFEIRYEDPTENKRYFYKLDGEGIRYEIVAFNRSIESGRIIVILIVNFYCYFRNY